MENIPNQGNAGVAKALLFFNQKKLLLNINVKIVRMGFIYHNHILSNILS